MNYKHALNTPVVVYAIHNRSVMCVPPQSCFSLGNGTLSPARRDARGTGWVENEVYAKRSNRIFEMAIILLREVIISIYTSQFICIYTSHIYKHIYIELSTMYN